MSRPYGAICVAAIALASSMAAVSSRSSGADAAWLGELDAHIQMRFQKADARFGVARIMTPGDRHRAIWRFTPENDAERNTVAGLERDRLHVVVYLAGRRLLTAADQGSTPAAAGPPAGATPLWAMRRLLAGPVTVCPAASPGRPPGPLPVPPAAEDLLDEGRLAFARFERDAAAHTFIRDGWSFLARPIRAGTETCLRCHRYQQGGSALALGDVLGVVFYGYRPMP